MIHVEGKYLGGGWQLSAGTEYSVINLRRPVGIAEPLARERQAELIVFQMLLACGTDRADEMM